MEAEEVELAIKRLQAIISVHEAILLAIFAQQPDKRALREAIVSCVSRLSDEMLFHDFGDEELQAQREARDLLLAQIDWYIAREKSK